MIGLACGVAVALPGAQRGGRATGGDRGLDLRAVGEVDVRGRHPVGVGVGLLRVGRVVEDHPDAAGQRDVASDLSTRALEPRRHSTIFPRTLAGSSVPSLHSAASAWRRAGLARRRGVHQRRRGQRGGHRRALDREVRLAGHADRDGREERALERRGGDRRSSTARRRRAHRARAGPALPAELAMNTPASTALSIDSSSGAERLRRVAAERDVEHVDAVGDGLVDRLDDVRRRAAGGLGDALAFQHTL